MTKTKIFPLIVLLALSSCSSLEESTTHGFAGFPQSDNALLIQGQKDPLLRAAQDSFKNGDRIGVFAFNAGTQEAFGSYANVPYITEANGLFYGEKGAGIKLEAKKADVTAYYPYSSEVKETKLSVDIADQTDASKTDILWGKGEASQLSGGYRMPVTFKHVLGLVEITFAPKDATHLLPKSIKVTAKNMLTSGTLDLVTGALSNGSTRKDVAVSADAGHKAYLLMMPGETLTALSFDFDGQAKEYKFDKPITIETGKKYALTFRPYSNKLIASSVAAYAEIPVETRVHPNTIQVTHMAPDEWFSDGYSTVGGEGKRRNYTIFFDKDRRQPIYVAFPLYKGCLGYTQRKDDWHYDDLIPQDVQPIVERYSYQPRTKRMNRGHMLPSASRNATNDLNHTTFFYTNIVPQNIENNNGIWEAIESAERGWTNRYDTLYVVCGPIFEEGKELEYVHDDYNNQIPCPHSLFRAILGKKGDVWKSMAVIIPNVNIPKKEWTVRGRKDRYFTTVKDLEDKLGFKFFTQLPADKADAVKSQKEPNQWK